MKLIFIKFHFLFNIRLGEFIFYHNRFAIQPQQELPGDKGESRSEVLKLSPSSSYDVALKFFNNTVRKLEFNGSKTHNQIVSVSLNCVFELRFKSIDL